MCRATSRRDTGREAGAGMSLTPEQRRAVCMEKAMSVDAALGSVLNALIGEDWQLALAPARQARQTLQEIEQSLAEAIRGDA